MAVLLFADGGFQRYGFLRDLDDFAHLVLRNAHFLRNFLRQGFASIFLQQLAGYADQLIDGFHHVHGNANRARLIRDRARNRLANPPGRIGGKLIALAVIKLFNRLDQTQITLLNQIQKQHAAPHIALRDRYHQAEVRLAQALLGVFIALLHAAGEFDFFLCGQQRHLADFLQIHAHGIIDGNAFGHGNIDFLLRRIRDNLRFRNRIVLQNFDVQPAERVQHAIELFAVHFQIAQRFQNLLVG